mmetsp:Transcript_8940/g.16081  ORF Transcript_8940/g.16081 Transcript_8940/m.16081 type:complete len:254 (+) Transcript_8940:393-1154(+)
MNTDIASTTVLNKAMQLLSQRCLQAEYDLVFRFQFLCLKELATLSNGFQWRQISGHLLHKLLEGRLVQLLPRWNQGSPVLATVPAGMIPAARMIISGRSSSASGIRSRPQALLPATTSSTASATEANSSPGGIEWLRLCPLYKAWLTGLFLNQIVEVLEGQYDILLSANDPSGAMTIKGFVLDEDLGSRSLANHRDLFALLSYQSATHCNRQCAIEYVLSLLLAKERRFVSGLPVSVCYLNELRNQPFQGSLH